MKYNEWQYGKRYSISLNGMVMIRREHVALGTVRVFQHDTHTKYDTEVMYYAERSFPSIIPFRAPKIWWRKLEKNETQV